jgi:hypothetical protein
VPVVVIHNGQTYYNLPNVLSGVDPFGYAKEIKAAALAAGKDENYYLRIPLTAALRHASGSIATIRSGQTTATLTCSVAPAASASSSVLGKWQFTASDPSMVQITLGSINSIMVAGTNKTAAPVNVLIVAKNELGLEACALLKVEPPFVEPPKFARAPEIISPVDGRVTLSYVLDLGSDLRKDESSINWYRCTDEKGSNPLKVAVSRRNKAETVYKLSDGDVGYYLMATIRPKHNVSEAGPMQTVYGQSRVAKDDVKVHVIDTDFQSFPADPQPKILPGTWTLDGYVAPEAGRNKTPGYKANPDSWSYGPGQSGAIGYHGLYPTARGARLFFTPAAGKYADMTVRAKFAPNKNSGQGFGSATQQFLDVYIKYDLATNTGYGLRIQRLTTEEIDALGYQGAGAVAGCAFFLAKFEKGVMTPLSKKVMSSAFQSECTVELTAKNGRLLASVTSSAETRAGDAFDYLKEVQFDVPIESNSYGGTGMLFTGTVGGNSVLVTGWHASWPK